MPSGPSRYVPPHADDTCRKRRRRYNRDAMLCAPRGEGEDERADGAPSGMM